MEISPNNKRNRSDLVVKPFGSDTRYATPNLTGTALSAHWLGDSEVKNEVKSNESLVISSATKSNRHEATGNPRGRPRNEFGKSDYSDKRMLTETHDLILQEVEKILAVTPLELAEKYRQLFSSFLDHSQIESYPQPVAVSEETTNIVINNVQLLIKKLPYTPVRSALIKELACGVGVNEAALVFDVHQSNVSRANSSGDRPFVHYLRQLGFTRSTRSSSHQFLIDWLGDDANCPYPSGGNNRVFFGGKDLMYAQYATSSLMKRIVPLNQITFHMVRKRERIGVRSGDIFISRDEVELCELRRQLENDDVDNDVDVAAIKEKIIEVEEKISFCSERKAYYRQTHQQLKGQSDVMIMTIDFTATQTSMSDKFHDFVVVVCTDMPLSIPESLSSAVIEPQQPPCKNILTPIPTIEKTPRRTKQQIAQEGGGRDLLPSFSQSLKEGKKKRKLEQPELNSENYKPNSTYFHFIIKRDESTPGQTTPYVRWACDFLFRIHRLDVGFKLLHLFSDGCGKHFKTYPTHWYMADLQFHLRSRFPSIVIEWDFLPPGDAHNRADAAAAHFKRPQKKLIQNFCLLSTPGHLAFACSELNNFYMIEADYKNFPEKDDVIIEEPWMRESFHFKYGDPYVGGKECNHLCKDKAACRHPCCKPVSQSCVDLQVSDRKGVCTTRKLVLNDAPRTKVGGYESLEEDSFWNSSTRLAYHSISSPRVSKLNTSNNYEYDDVSDYDGDLSDGDFIDC